jgi:uncharacterized RDD family membrane protein YckC
METQVIQHPHSPINEDMDQDSHHPQPRADANQNSDPDPDPDQGTDETRPGHPRASLIRRCAAMLYDFLLIIAVWMLSTAILVTFVMDGEAATGHAYQVFLYLEMMFFYLVFWRMRGQTLGMQVWKIRTVDLNGRPISFARGGLRFLAATLSTLALGVGFLRTFVTRDQQTWHDSISQSQVVYVGTKPYSSESRTPATNESE